MSNPTTITATIMPKRTGQVISGGAGVGGAGAGGGGAGGAGTGGGGAGTGATTVKLPLNPSTSTL